MPAFVSGLQQESRYLTRKYGIHTLPMFLIYYNAKLVYAGMLVGLRARVRAHAMRSWAAAEAMAGSRSF